MNKTMHTAAGIKVSRLKDFIDQAVAWVAWLALSPLISLLALGVRLDSSGPAFFRQERIGKDGQPFVLNKFRTMRGEPAAQAGAGAVSEQDRITRFGHWLRATSLDELPQLINIINGEMSLVGPRPTLRYQVEAYNDFQRRRLLMKPGVTGWVAVNGRNAIPWEERIKLDVWYVDHWSLKLDWEILFRTIGVWLKAEGIYGSGGVNDDFITSTAAASRGLKISNSTGIS